MPRKKKISINEALEVFKEHNLEVLVRPIVPPEPEPEVHTQEPGIVRKIGTTTTVIDLYAQHCLGSGGSLIIAESGEKQAVGNETATYGPGRVTVPTRLVAQLMHQDQLARRADQRLLEKEQRAYVIVQRAGADGRVANVKIEVDAMNGFDFQPAMVI